MPVYEYLCTKCNKKFDEFKHKFSEDIPVCPKCNSNKTVQRIFSAFRVKKTYKDVYDGILSDNNLVKGLQNNDPKALIEWNNRMEGNDSVAPEWEETMGRIGHGERFPRPPFIEEMMKPDSSESTQSDSSETTQSVENT